MASVVVIGGGLAGQCAAIEAAHCGANVILLEKEGKLGGNSAKATSGINGCGTEFQALLHLEDDKELFVADTMKSATGGNSNSSLVEALVTSSADAVQWLHSKFQIPLNVVSQLGGHSRPRTHRAPDKADGTPVPIGYMIMSTMEKYMRTEMKEKIEIVTDFSVQELLVESTNNNATGGVSGVRGLKAVKGDDGAITQTEVVTAAKAVILATGGFCNDRSESSLLREFVPHLYSKPTTNGPFATGDGMKMARAIGATLVDMDKVQLHPTGFIDPRNPNSPTKFLGPEALRGSGGILVNTRGERFVNELDLRSVVSDAIVKQGDVFAGGEPETFYACCILNQSCVKTFGEGAVNFYTKRLSLFTPSENVEQLAALIGCDKNVLKQTLDTYAKSSSEKSCCDVTGKRVYPNIVSSEGPFWLAYVTPSLHYTMGGVKIDECGRVQKVSGGDMTVPGLLAAGEVTGGVHGGNRLAGNSLLECVVFGRKAGSEAAKTAAALSS